MTTPYIIFKIQEKQYATPAINVVEVIKSQQLEVFEKMPEDILGVISFRNKIINILDIEKKLDLYTYKPQAQTLILNVNGNFVGIMIDEVKDIINIKESDIEPTPYNNENSPVSNILKVEDKIIGILELNNIFEKGLIAHSETALEKTTNTELEAQSFAIAKNIKTNDSYISFKLGENIYCINFEYIKEFSNLNPSDITKLPQTPKYLEGIINLRGEVINIFDIKSFLNIEEKPIDAKSKIVIVSDKTIKIGVIVDDIYDIITIPEENLNKEQSIRAEKNPFCQSELVLDNKKVISVLDVEKLLKDDRLFIDIA